MTLCRKERDPLSCSAHYIFFVKFVKEKNIRAKLSYLCLLILLCHHMHSTLDPQRTPQILPLSQDKPTHFLFPHIFDYQTLLFLSLFLFTSSLELSLSFLTLLLGLIISPTSIYNTVNRSFFFGCFHYLR